MRRPTPSTIRSAATVFLILFCVASFAQSVAAEGASRSGRITLLTVAEDSEDPLAQRSGGTADISLEIKDGSGRIFIDSFPLTKIDTQSSVRSANQIACSYLDEECAQFDFFYTIRAGSIVVGGPSAGGAIAVLTAAVLKGYALNESIALTGTINSGGLIGPVGGVKEKVEAARKNGITLVLTSAFGVATELNRTYALLLNGTNASLNTSEINLSALYIPVDLSALGIPVREVTTLDEALSIFTGKTGLAQELPPLVEDESYTEIMRGVAQDLCVRRERLLETVSDEGKRTGAAGEDAGPAFDANVTRRIDDATRRGDWYSLASYCFSDLIKLRVREYEGLSQRQRSVVYSVLAKDIGEFERNIGRRNLTTLAELETSMIITERLGEAHETLAEMNLSNLSAQDLGFAAERANSADVWSAFFRMRSQPLRLEEKRLESACVQKLNEAEERINYAEIYLPARYLSEAHKALAQAKGASDDGRHIECLFRASKAQADADILAGSLSIPREKLDRLVTQKLAAAEFVIRRQEAKGLFPILGYSYYRYASSLAAHDPYSALTFAEYSIELSNLDMYFPKEERERSFTAPDPFLVLLFTSGALLGIVIGVLIPRRAQAKSTQKKSGAKQGRKKEKKK